MITKKNSVAYKKVIAIIFYSIIYSIGLQYFLSPANLLTTGLAGLAQIIAVLIPVKYGIIYIVINIPGILIALRYLGKSFTAYSVLNIVTVSLTTLVFSNVDFVNNFEPLINAIFGGMIIGFSVGMILKLGASSGGTDFFALYLLKYKNIDYQKVNTIVNVVILVVGIIVLHQKFGTGIELGLYTMISLFIRNAVIDQTFTNPHSVTLFIVGEDLEELSSYINNSLKRGTTIINGVQGGYTHNNKQIVMTTLNKYEYSVFMENVFIINPHVFINIMDTNHVVGNFQKDKGDVDEIHGA